MKSNSAKSFAAILVITAALAVCCSKEKTNTTGLYVPGKEDATATATLQDLQQGRVLYIDHCAACHNLYSPDNYSAGQWPQILSGMAPRAGLSSANTLLVKKYLTRGN